MLSDETIIALYERYKSIMFHRANRILRDIHLAEDAVQNSFAKIWNSRNTLRIDSVDTYRTHALMNIIVDNVAKTMYRQIEKRKSDSNMDDLNLVLETSDDFDVLADITTRELIAEIDKALGEIDSLTADILKLKFIFGYNNKEIAGLMGIAPTNVGVKIIRGKRKLRAKLDSSGVTYDA